MSPKTNLQNQAIRLKSKENITAAALSLFSKNGYGSTSVRMIAQEAGVSLGLMYNYFKSKEEMLLSILADTFKDLEGVFQQTEADDPKARFRSSIERFLNMIELNKEKLRMLTQMGLHQNKFDMANNLTKEIYEQSVQKISQNLVLLGYKDQPILEARLIVATLDGLAFESLLMENTVPLLEMKNLIIRKYCNEQ